MSLPSLLQPIVALNNQAGVLSSSGEYETALSLYRDALIKTEEIFLEDDTETSSEMNYGTSDAASNPPLDTPSTTAPSKRIHASLENDEYTDTDFVYRTHIHLSEEDTAGQGLEELELHCTILFNMALSYHLSALDENKDKEASQTTKKDYRLKKALKLYEYSFSVQVDLRSMSITSLLALVNNCASIYKLLGKTERAEKFYSHMLSTLMAMIENGEASEVEQLDGFLLNACRLILQDVTAPAA